MPAAGLSVSVYDSAFSLCGVWNSLHAVSNDFFMLIHLTFNLKYSMHCNKSLLLCVCAYWLLYLLFVFANRFVGVLITSICCADMCFCVDLLIASPIYLSCFSLTELKKPKSSAMTCYRWLLPSIHLHCLHWTSFAVFWKMPHQCFMKGSLKHFI